MEFDIVMATRNRRDALRLSLPLMLSQSRVPRKFIVVDSSDQHGDIKRLIEDIFRDYAPNADLEIYRSEAGTAYQRNIGLKQCRSPVVFFPDDDALWFEGLSDAVMRIYEVDCRQEVGAVCPKEVKLLPKTQSELKRVYRMAPRDRFRMGIGRSLDRLGNQFVRNPIFIIAHSRMRRKPIPGWLDAEDASLIGPMMGFKMTFRTDLIRKAGFDECLGRYSLFEDYDASLAVLKDHLIVCAHRGKAFHFRSPENRTSGLEWGVLNVLNLVYLVCKHSESDSYARRSLRKYSYYKLVRYLLQANTPYGWQRARGAWHAIRCIPSLLESPAHALRDNYLRVKTECLK